MKIDNTIIKVYACNLSSFAILIFIGKCFLYYMDLYLMFTNIDYTSSKVWCERKCVSIMKRKFTSMITKCRFLKRQSIIPIKDLFVLEKRNLRYETHKDRLLSLKNVLLRSHALTYTLQRADYAFKDFSSSCIVINVINIFFLKFINLFNCIIFVQVFC